MAVGTSANPATSPTSATGTSCCRCIPFSGGRKRPPSFTDSEWTAARVLVLLSAGTLPSSAVSYAAKPKRPLAPPLDELQGGHRVRIRQRRRTLSSLYEVTRPLGDSRGGDGEEKRRRLVLSGDGNGDLDGYVCAVRRDGDQKRRRLVLSGDGNGDLDGYVCAVRRDGDQKRRRLLFSGYGNGGRDG